MFLLFQSYFRLSEKNEKDKKRKVLTPVSATPTHMLRICVNPIDGGTFPKRCTKTLEARRKFITSISHTHTKKASAALSRSFHSYFSKISLSIE